VATSVVEWNGTSLPTSFFDASIVGAQIPASDIVAVGTPTITVFNPGGGTSNPLTFLVTGGEMFPHSVAVDPTGKFVYVANWGCSAASAGSVSMYTIDATTGVLTSIGTVAAGMAPVSVAVDPTGKSVYVVGGSISAYNINGTTGALTPIGAVSGSGGSSLALHPTGKFAYVGAGFPAESVSMFIIDPTTGALTFIGTIGAALNESSNDIEVAMHPSGKFAYAVGDNCALDTFTGNVDAYSINLTSGTLSSIGSPVAAGVCPSSVAVDPLGRFAYVTDDSGLNGPQDDNVAIYAIDGTTGALTGIGLAGTGMGPRFVAVDPTGKFAYVANFLSNDVSMYTINGTTGALTSIGTIAAGSAPTSIAVHPSGKFAYVTNSGSNNVSMYSIDASGTLTLIGTIGT
jgi:6-phosphogluconolactonase (cycloisomerase 2 family)